MAENAIPDRPSRVTLALYMLYVSLGIGVVTFFVTWLRFGAPGPSRCFLFDTLMMITTLHFLSSVWAVQWETHGGLLIAAIVPIALWLYYMIGKGRSWARTALLIFVILGTLDCTLRLVIPFILPIHGRTLASLSDFLISPYALQAVLKIVAVVLLFGRAPSNWFKALKILSKPSTSRAKPWITNTAVALLVLLVVGAVSWRAVPWFRDRALIEAIRKNNVGEVQELLKKGADVNARDTRLGYPALVDAAQWGRLDMVRLLLHNGADVNSTRTRYGGTALMWASRAGHLDVVRLLLEQGADINAKDNGGSTALMEASWTGQREVIKLLLEKGASVNERTDNGLTALMRAATGDHLEIVRLLLENGADMNAKDGKGQTALGKALMTNSRGVANLLLDKGAKVDTADN